MSTHALVHVATMPTNRLAEEAWNKNQARIDKLNASYSINPSCKYVPYAARVAPCVFMS